MGSAPPRPIRIPRASSSTPRLVRRPGTLRAPVAGPTTGSEYDRRANRAGTRRAVRISILFVAAIALVFGAFALYAGASPGGTYPGTWQDVELFGVLALGLCGAGTLLALGPTPRAVEVGATATVVVGRFGGRRRFPSGPALSVRLVQHLPAGLLSPAAVDIVELRAGKVRGTYFLEEGIVTIPDSGGAP